MKRFLTSPIAAMSALILLFLGIFTVASAATQVVAPDEASITDLLSPVYQAFRDGHYIAAGALALVLAIAVIKRYAPKYAPKLAAIIHTDAGGAIATLLLSFATTIATVTSSGDAWHWAMLTNAGSIAIAAAGGYVLIKKLIITPLIASSWYTTKAPSWFKLAMNVVLWIFDKPDAIKAAEAAGAAAVAAKPSAGAASIVGEPEKF